MRKRVVWVALCAVALMSLAAGTSVVRSQDRVQEEFHQTYPLAPGGRVSLENINGSVRINAWDRNEVRVDAVKWAYTRERLQEAEVRVDASGTDVRISTKYPDQNQTFTNDREGRLQNPATVEYTLSVPRSARIDAVELINGGLEIEGLAGDVRASSINGKVVARNLTGEAKLSTINNTLDATFDRLDAAKPISLSSINGNVIVTIPSDADANLRASTVHGAINNDFGLPVRKGDYVGRELAGQLGQGSARIRLANVNGQITIRRAQDGRQTSQAVNLLTITEDGGKNKSKEFKDDIKAAMDEAREVQREVMDAQREAARAQRDAARTQREAARAQRDVQRAQRDVQRDVENATRAAREVGGDYRLTEQDSKSFAVQGSPRVSVETFDGSVNIRAWDKQEVSYSVAKRAGNEEQMRAISIRAEQRGDEVLIKAEFDKATAQRMGGSYQAQAAFEIFVPRKSTLRVSSGDGSLGVEGVSGEMTMNTGDGSVDVRDSQGRLTVNTGDGRIHVANFDGALQANTGDGGINLDGRFTSLSAQTGDGSISLALPNNANATIETNAEAVMNDGLATSEDNDETQRVRRWRVGGGGPVLSLKTGDGRIYLRRSGGSQ